MSAASIVMCCEAARGGVSTLMYLFADGRSPACVDASDSHDDGRNDLSGAVHMLDYLFLNGQPRRLPSQTAGRIRRATSSGSRSASSTGACGYLIVCTVAGFLLTLLSAVGFFLLRVPTRSRHRPLPCPAAASAAHTPKARRAATSWPRWYEL